MTPLALIGFLEQIVRDRLMFSTMIWGPPGIGKSSIVAQIAAQRAIGFVDVRLSQLAPTDLRGLPVPENGISRWYPPEFLPREGAGILFLDELNLAPPTMQGMAQQLILDRRVGSYVVPDGWFIWAAGNRKEDLGAIFDMPAPLANRFLHLSVEPDFESFKEFALSHAIHEQILAFLAYRPELLHHLDRREPAWPSPRSWMMASALHTVGLPIAPAVGVTVMGEFMAYQSVYALLPDLEQILQGQGADIDFPAEPSTRYATVTGLVLRAESVDQALRGYHWLSTRAPAEWTLLFINDLLRVAKARNQQGELAMRIAREPELRARLEELNALHIEAAS